MSDQLDLEAESLLPTINPKKSPKEYFAVAANLLKSGNNRKNN
jgi:hypothetical protein